MSYDGPGAEPTDSVSPVLYAVVREALTNAYKHGRHDAPVLVRIRLDARSSGLEVTNLAAEPSPTVVEGFGLRGMRERVVGAGGALVVETRRRPVRPRGRAPRGRSGAVIDILVVDDQSLIRNAVRDLVAQEPDLRLVGSAENAVEAVRLTRELRPHVVVMDVRMPVLDGIEATRMITGDAGSAGGTGPDPHHVRRRPGLRRPRRAERGVRLRRQGGGAGGAAGGDPHGAPGRGAAVAPRDPAPARPARGHRRPRTRSTPTCRA